MYGVDPADIEVTVDYVASGTLDVTIPDGVSEDAIIDSIQEAISDVLGVHASDVVVTIDDDGSVHYSITGSTYEEADLLQNAISQEEFVSKVNDDLNESESEITIESSTSNDDVEVVISATVDTTDATGTVDTSEGVADIADNYGFTDSSTEDHFITSAPTFLPSSSPVTSVPTAAPSFIGLVVSVDITRLTTEPLPRSEVEELESLVARAHGVDPEDVTSVTEYVTIGSMTISIPDSVSEEDALAALTTTMSAALGGVNEEAIALILNPETGEVTYSVSTTDYDEAVTVLSALENPSIIENLATDSGVRVSNVSPSSDIVAEVNVVVNADDVSVPLQQAENQIDALLDDHYNSNTEVTFVSSAPSVLPSAEPSISPSTNIPTAAPTITGAVVFVEMEKLVTETLTDEEVQDLINLAESTFGLQPGNVEADVSYDISGLIEISTDDSDISEEELVSALQSSIADALNIHTSDVTISIDPETGAATYTISSESAEEAQSLQDALQISFTNDAISSRVSTQIPTIADVIVDPNYGVYAEVTLTVDSTNTDDVQGAIQTFEIALEEDWTEIETESVYISSTPSSVPSIVPSVMPTTVMPSPQPSITGLVVTIDATSQVTDELTPAQISELTDAIAAIYDVSPEDVSSEITYVTTGTMQLSLAEDTSEDEVVDAVTASLAELLNIHPSEVTVSSVDMKTGEIEYEVSSENYADTYALQSSLDALSTNDIEDVMQKSLPSVQVNSNNVDDNIEVDVAVVVDGSEVENIREANTVVNDILNDQGYNVDTDVAIVTSKPSMLPTFTTLVPSPAPSVTGIVVTLTLSRSDDLLNMTEIEDLEAQLALDYGVDPDDVTVEATYAVSGSIDVDNIPDDVSNSELEEILEQNIADALGVHSMSVDVNVDPETGDITYTVTSKDDVTATSIRSTLESASFLNDLNNEIAEDISTVSIDSISTEDEVEMNIVVTIDATEATSDVEEVNQQVISDFENEGYDTNEETSFVTAKPTMSPVLSTLSPTIRDFTTAEVAFDSFDCNTRCVEYASLSACIQHLKEDWIEILSDNQYHNVDVEVSCGRSIPSNPTSPLRSSDDVGMSAISGGMIVEVSGTALNVYAAVDFLADGCFTLRRFGDICGPSILLSKSPTGTPSVMPTKLPTTTIPSKAPTAVGWTSTVIATIIATIEISETTVNDYVNEVASLYGVEFSDVAATTSYAASGSLQVQIPSEVSESELTDAIVKSISDSLGVHPRHVEVSIDMETGQVEFVITSESYDEADSKQADLVNNEIRNDIISSIESSVPAVDVTDYDVSDNISATIEISIDANEASNDLTQAAWQAQALFSDAGFEVAVDTTYITEAPTVVPSFTPTTSLPTATPTITGSVAILELTKSVTESIPENEVTDIQNEVAETYGVDAEDVTVEVVYQTTGSLDIDVTDDSVSEEDLEEALEDEIAQLLGVHESNVNVNITDGVAFYTITSDTAETAQDIQNVLNDPNSATTIDNAIEFVDVTDVNIDEEITADVVVTVDTSDASNNLNNAADALEESFEDQGYNADTENVFITSAPTFVPSMTPSGKPITSIPSSLPTITGEIASVSISGAVTDDMSSEDIDTIASEIAEIYGVDQADVETSVDYITSGSLDVTIPDGVSREDAIIALQESISHVLGVHPKDVVVTIDDDGDVTYQVTGSTYEEAEAIQDAASQAEFASQVTSDLSEGDSGVTVESATSDAPIEVVISTTVDTTEATGTVDPTAAIVDLTQEFGLTDSSAEEIFITSSPTLLASNSPLTSMPSAAPSFIGLVVSVDITRPTTAALDQSEVNDLEIQVANAYGVDADDISSVTEYVTTGIMTVSIPESVSEDEALASLTFAISESLGVREEDISLTIDSETGEVSYTVSTTDYDETAAILTALQDSTITDSLATESGLLVSDVSPSADIIAQVNFVVSADEVSIPLQQAENQLDALLDDTYNSDFEVEFITSSPSALPSANPSLIPTSNKPTAAPSITGAVVFVEMSKPVTESLTNEEIEEMITLAEDVFGVYPGNVAADVNYDITGTVSISTDGSEVSEEELSSALQSSIANILNVHENDVQISIDPGTGVATYTITSATAEAAQTLQDALKHSSTSDEITEEVSKSLPAVDNVIMDPDYGIYANVALTVDTTNTDDVDNAINAFEEAVESDWIDVETESVYITSTPTSIPSALPSITPISIMPSRQPSMTGLIVTIDVTRAVTSDLSVNDLTDLTNGVIDVYAVSSDDVSAEVTYVATGTMQLSIPEDTTEEEVADAVLSSLAVLLEIHPKDVTITSVNVETGEVEYEVTSDNYANASARQSALDSLSSNDIEDTIQQSLPSLQVDSNNVNDDIEVGITIAVDASEAGNVGESNSVITDVFNNQGYDVDTDVTIVTPGPSVSPTFTTLVPSSAPSVTGIVITLTLSRSGDLLNSTEIDNLEAQLAIDYGVDLDDVTVEAVYTVSGSIEIDDIPADIPDSDLEEILEQSIADALGVHSMNVDVNINPETGDVTYTVTSNDDVTATNIQDTLKSDSFLNNLNSEIVENIPSADIGSVSAEDEIEMDIVATIDASESPADLDEVSDQITEDYENEGFSADSEIEIVTAAPTVSPAISTLSPTPVGYVSGALRDDYSCSQLCGAYNTFEECLEQMEAEFNTILIVNGFNEVGIVVECGSLVISLRGVGEEVHEALEFLSSGCYLLPSFGYICGPATIMTETPTNAPVSAPTLFPTSVVPSRAPHITGQVSIINAISVDGVSSDVDDVQLLQYETSIASHYGVDPTDIESVPTYIASGSLTLDIPSGQSQAELTNALIDSIAEAIGVHPANIAATIDMETGEASFIVTSDTFDQAVQEQLSLFENMSDIMTNLEQSAHDLGVSEFAVHDDVRLNIEFTVDTNSATNDLTQAAYFTEQMFLTQFDTVIENSFVTATPSIHPSISPTTSLPTATPSITGSVSILELTKAVTESISGNDVTDIQNEVAETYGVDRADVTVEIVYETTGSVAIHVTDDSVSEQELEEALEEEIAQLLGIYKGSVHVNITDGIAEYTITAESAETAQGIQNKMNEPTSTSTLNDAMDIMDVTEIDVDDVIIADVVVTVDTSNASNNLNNAADELQGSFEAQGYNTDTKNIFRTAAPTVLPSQIPSSAPITAIPTTAPTATGPVVHITLSGVTLGEMTEVQLSQIGEELSDAYGVDTDEITLTATYVNSGIVGIDLPEDATLEEGLSELKDVLAASLNIHPRNVIVDVSGDEIMYRITSDDYDVANQIRAQLNSDDFEMDLNQSLQDVNVTELSPDSHMETIVSVVVEVENADPVDDIEDVIGDITLRHRLTYDPTIRSLVITATPTTSPTSPTIAPSFTGLVVTIELESVATSETSAEELDQIENLAAEVYDVSADDIHVFDEYITTGEIQVSVPPGMSSEDVTDLITQALADSLEIRATDVVVVFDPTSETAFYAISTPEYESTLDVQTSMNTAEFTTSLAQELSGFVDLIEVSPVDEITSQVTVIIDADKSDADGIARANNEIEIILDDAYEVDLEVSFITSAPTVLPTTSPSGQPSSSIPSPQPTITGSIVLIDMTKPVIASMTDEQIQEILDDTVTSFGVSIDEVDADVSYITLGQIGIVHDGAVLDEPLASAMKTSIAETLGIHASRVEVSIGEKGEVLYEVTCTTAEECRSLQNHLSQDTANDNILAQVARMIPEVTDVFTFPTEGIFANIDIVVDTTDVDDVTDALNAFESEMDDAWDVIAEEDFVTPAPTTTPSISPSIEPSSQIPSTPPSVTGLSVTIDLSLAATENVQEETLDEIKSIIAYAYGISEASVSLDVEYVTSGSLTFDNIPEDISEETVADLLITRIAAITNVHPKDVIIDSINLTTGQVEFTISSNSFDIADDLELRARVLESFLQQDIPGIEIGSTDLSDNIISEISTVVPVRYSQNVADANSDIASQSAALGLSTDFSVDYIVYEGPSAAYSRSPSAPDTVIPTRSPSETGEFSILHLERAVLQQITISQLDEMMFNLADLYGVQPSDVSLDVTYENYGFVSADPMRVNDVERILGSLLGAHNRYVELDVSGEFFTSASDIQKILNMTNILNDNTFSAQLNIALWQENMVLDDLRTNYDITESIDIEVDIRKATNDPEAAAIEFSQLYASTWSVIDSMVTRTFTPSKSPNIAPTATPTTSLPTPRGTSAPKPDCIDASGWSNGYGFMCADYERQGWCSNGEVLAPFSIGARYNYPEIFCCSCRTGMGSTNEYVESLNDETENAELALGTCVNANKDTSDKFFDDMSQIQARVDILDSECEDTNIAIEVLRADYMAQIDLYQETILEEFRKIYEALEIELESIPEDSYYFIAKDGSDRACVDWLLYETVDATDPDLSTSRVLDDIPDEETCLKFCGYDHTCVAADYNARTQTCVVLSLLPERTIPMDDHKCFVKQVLPYNEQEACYCRPESAMPSPTIPTIIPTPAPTLYEVCRFSQCGCGPDFLSAWCTNENSMTGVWCGASQERCDFCGAVWCEESLDTSFPTTARPSPSPTPETFLEITFVLNNADKDLDIDATLQSVIDNYGEVNNVDPQYIVTVDLSLSPDCNADIESIISDITSTHQMYVMTDETTFSVVKPTYDDAFILRNSMIPREFLDELELAAIPCGVENFLPQDAVEFVLEVTVDLRAIDALRVRENAVRAANPHYDDILFMITGSESDIPSQTPSSVPIIRPSIDPTVSPSATAPTESPSLSVPTIQPSIAPSLSPTKDVWKFNLIFVPDASELICNMQENSDDLACDAYYRQISFMQNITRELMVDSNDATLIPYDADPRMEFDRDHNSVEEYADAIAEHYWLKEAEAGLPADASYIGALSFLLNYLTNTPLDEDKNHLVVLTITKFSPTAKPLIYSDIIRKYDIDMAIVCMTDLNCDDIFDTFRAFLRNDRDLFYRANSPDEVSSEEFIKGIKNSRIEPKPRLD